MARAIHHSDRERAHHVERLCLIMGQSSYEVASLLGIAEDVIEQDISRIRREWRKNAEGSTLHAPMAYEEIECLRYLARLLTVKIERARDEGQCVKLATAAARALFYAGRLRQGGPA